MIRSSAAAAASPRWVDDTVNRPRASPDSASKTGVASATVATATAATGPAITATTATGPAGRTHRGGPATTP